MPFTLAHAAAVLPLRRLKLVWSAVVIGTFAPDFGLFLAIPDGRRDSHHLPHLLTFALPMSLVALWIFHRLLKRPLMELAPEGLRLRLTPYLRRFEFGGWRRFTLVVCSICIGMATHVLWDSFTHPYTWAYYHWPWLRQPVVLQLFGMERVTQNYSWLQWTSSLLGCAILAAWFVLWYRSASPAGTLRKPVFAPQWRVVICLALVSLPWATALWLAAQRGHDAEDFLHVHTFADYMVLLPGSLFALELLVFGILTTRILEERQPKPS
jgi:hypothetical protein